MIFTWRKPYISKVLIIGPDGTTWDIIKPLVDEPKLLIQKINVHACLKKKAWI